MMNTLEKIKEEAEWCVRAYNKLQENPEALRELYEETQGLFFYGGVATWENVTYSKESLWCRIQYLTYKASYLEGSEEFIEKFTDIYRRMHHGMFDGTKIEGY